MSDDRVTCCDKYYMLSYLYCLSSFHVFSIEKYFTQIEYVTAVIDSSIVQFENKQNNNFSSFGKTQKYLPLSVRRYIWYELKLFIVLDAYTSRQLVYEWQEGSSVNFVPGMALSQFDLMGSPYRNLTFVRREGEFSVLQVSFNLQRNTGYFLIQVRIKIEFYFRLYMFSFQWKNVFSFLVFINIQYSRSTFHVYLQSS